MPNAVMSMPVDIDMNSTFWLPSYNLYISDNLIT